MPISNFLFLFNRDRYSVKRKYFKQVVRFVWWLVGCTTSSYVKGFSSLILSSLERGRWKKNPWQKEMVASERMFLPGCIEWCEYTHNITFANKLACTHTCRNIKNHLNVCRTYTNKLVFIETNYVLIRVSSQKYTFTHKKNIISFIKDVTCMAFVKLTSLFPLIWEMDISVATFSY